MKLRDLGEGGLIRKIRERFGAKADALQVGIGDDAAVADFPRDQSIVFCSDLVAEDTHFIRTLHPPDSIGYKAVAVNVSDVAAMGGVPEHALITLAVSREVEVAWVKALYAGLRRAARKFGVSSQALTFRLLNLNLARRPVPA